MKKRIEDYDRPHIIGEKRSVRRGVRGGVVCVALLASVVVALAALWFFAVKSDYIAVAECKYYLLILDESESEREAQTIANAIADAGGGGYLINDSVFRAAASVYRSEAEAASVAARLSEYPAAYVLPMICDKSKLKRTGDANFDADFAEIAEFPIRLIDETIVLSERLDRNETSESAALYRLQLLYGELTAKAEAAAKLLPLPAEKLSDCYDDLLSGWEYLVGGDSDNRLSHRLKYYCCHAVCSYESFRKNL